MDIQEIGKPFINLLYNAASIRRWNDKVRPVDFRELDKQAHKMVVAYVLGKYEEDEDDFNWADVIEGGIFELLQRVTVTDIKPQLFHKIEEDKETYQRLNRFVFRQLQGSISSLGDDFRRRFRAYFEADRETKARRILRAAHFYPTKWEFEIIDRARPVGYEMKEIRANLDSDLEKHEDLKGMQELLDRRTLDSFVNLCGELRFQFRWSHLDMRPHTSVLGHMLIVAILSYLMSRKKKVSDRRCYNNFFTGLFHDLPEALTRDIISPVKRCSKVVEKLIKTYEQEQMEKEVYKLLPAPWQAEMRLFTEKEFDIVARVHGEHEQCSATAIERQYNADQYDARDGHLIYAVDKLAAFVEAHLARQNGTNSHELDQAITTLTRKYTEQMPRVAGIDFASIYKQYIS